MKYVDFLGRDAFSAPELLAFANGNLVEDPPEGFEARLPLPPMLMLDRLVSLQREGPAGRVWAARAAQMQSEIDALSGDSN